MAHFYGIVFTLFAMFYSILGGMHSIVLGDMIKYIILGTGCIAVGIIAVMHLRGNTLNVPAGWDNPFFGWDLGLDWKGIVDDANKKIQDDGFGLFSIFFYDDVVQRRACQPGGPCAKLRYAKSAEHEIAERSFRR